MTLSHPESHRPGALRRAVRAVSERLFLDRQADFWLRELHPAWSLRECRAEVVDVRVETADTRTFVLRPNARWRGHRAGQYVTVDVEVDGARVRRCYSLSSAPSAELLTITIKRVPGGRVSTWLHHRVGVGDTVVLGAAAGDFVVPDPRPDRMLFIAGGSGITPILAILDDLGERGPLRDVVVVDYVRSADDIIARDRLAALAERHPALKLHIVCDDDPSSPRGFDEATLESLVPDLAERDTWLCGPPGLMARAEAFWAARDIADRLRVERFVAAAARATTGEGTVTLSRSGRTIAPNGAASLLEQLERGGERPAHGCRMGICQSCRCRKVSGVVENTITGAISDEPDQDIQICISVPRGDVALDL